MNENVSIELAKGWFVAAQLCMILAGFLFASSGISWGNSRDNVENTFNFLQEMYKENYTLSGNYSMHNLPLGKNISDKEKIFESMALYYSESAKSNLKGWIVYFSVAMVFVFVSFFFWSHGMDILKNKKKNNP